MQADTTKEWFYEVEGQQVGPVSHYEVTDLARRRVLAPGANKVWFEGLSDWIDCGEITGLFDTVEPATPGEAALTPVQGQSEANEEQRYQYDGAAVSSVSFSHFVWSFVGTLVLGTLVVVAAGATAFLYDQDRETAVIVGAVALFVSLLLVGCLGITTYYYFKIIRSAWKVIPVSLARTTPDRAVWLGFVPVWTIYWNFVSYWGWSQDYANFVKRDRVPGAPVVKEGDFQAFAVLKAVGAFSFIPLLGTLLALASLASWIFFFTSVRKMAEVVNFFALHSAPRTLLAEEL